MQDWWRSKAAEVSKRSDPQGPRSGCREEEWQRRPCHHHLQERRREAVPGGRAEAGLPQIPAGCRGRRQARCRIHPPPARLQVGPDHIMAAAGIDRITGRTPSVRSTAGHSAAARQKNLGLHNIHTHLLMPCAWRFVDLHHGTILLMCNDKRTRAMGCPMRSDPAAVLPT